MVELYFPVRWWKCRWGKGHPFVKVGRFGSETGCSVQMSNLSSFRMYVGSSCVYNSIAYPGFAGEVVRMFMRACVRASEVTCARDYFVVYCV